MSKRDEITNEDDLIDSRDIDERIKYLEAVQDEWEDDEITVWADSDEGRELHNLCALRDELDGYCEDWKCGVTLIRDTYFREYAEDLVKDIGDLPSELPGYIEANINWQGVANDIQQDYTSADFDGVTYWVR